MTLSSIETRFSDSSADSPGEQTIFGVPGRQFGADFILGMLVRCSAALVLVMLIALVFVLTRAAVPSIRAFGARFLITSSWRPNEREVMKRDASGNIVRDEDGEPVKEILPPEFGALPVIYGTSVSSALALVVAVPMSLGAALFLVRIGPWLTPTSVKCGMLGILLTCFLMLLSRPSFLMIVLACFMGIGLTCLLIWVAWQVEDPRIGTRWVLVIPTYVGVFIIGLAIIRLNSGVSLLGSSILGTIIVGCLHFLAPSAISIISFLIEFLAAIPSIAYGLWGLFIVSPFLQDHVETPLNRFFGWVPFLRFQHTEGFPSGRDMLCAGLLLGIMILPIITSISRDILRAVPRIQIEGSQALGATWWQSSWAMLRYGRSGLFGAIMLGLARAAGETMAVAMVIGNDPHIHSSILDPAQTMASLLANEFREASTDLHRSALSEVALILLIMSLAFNIVARYFVLGTGSRSRG